MHGQGRTKAPRSTARRLIAAVAVTALALAACASLSVDGESLDGTHWRAVSVAGKPPIPGSAPTLVFDGGRIQGSAGCNSYSSSDPVGISNGTLVIGTTLMTLGACVGSDGEDLPVMAVEEAFSTALGAADHIGLRDAHLVISGPNGELVFEPQP